MEIIPHQTTDNPAPWLHLAYYASESLLALATLLAWIVLSIAQSEPSRPRPALERIEIPADGDSALSIGGAYYA